MPSSSNEKANSHSTQTEKPHHYKYLKEFRVEQCQNFLQHKCTQHKPFTCFYWHFMNQRRRRPLKKRDGTFNYNPDVYCTSYDETSGICQNGDDCQYLHRTAGDTEKRYHLRYYKTGICVHDTDARGYCVKNGPHCAFAHGFNDLRTPVYDIREQQAIEAALEGPNGTTGPNNLDKERNAINEDPKWQDAQHVVECYKTEPCKRPPRLCRQGYACPQYHNNRDRRRSPKKFKYRSTPCPDVKQGDEWGDPANCESGDNCPYCHTRTEQQFHREIYKSTKCNDVLSHGHCPRGAFCAFAHHESEISAVRDLGPDNSTDLAAILSNALPASTTQLSPNSNKDGTKKNDSSQDQDNVSSSNQQSQPSANRTSEQNNREFNTNCSNNNPFPAPISRPRSYSSSTNQSSDSLPHYPKAPGSEREDKEASIQRQLQLIDNDRTLDPLEKSSCKENVYMDFGYNLMSNQSSLKSGMSSMANMYYPAADTVESVVGNALDDLNIDINVEASLDRELENEPQVNHTSALIGSAPMNIPHSSDLHELSNFSPAAASPLTTQMLHLSLGSSDHHSLDKTQYYGSQSSFPNPNKFGQFSNSSQTLYDLPSQNASGATRISFNPNEYQRLADEVSSCRTKLALFEEAIAQIHQMYELLINKEKDEALQRENLLKQQRDDALAKVSVLKKELTGSPYLRRLTRIAELESLSLYQLAQLQEQLQEDIDKLNQIVYRRSSESKCLACSEEACQVILLPCNHFVLCGKCAPLHSTCPSCHGEISQKFSLPAPPH